MSQVDMKRWRPHLRAAKVAGVTLAQYARKQGLSRHTLYAALRAERDRRGLASKASPRAKAARRRLPRQAAFAPVVVSGGSARLTVRFPSGVALECHDLGAAQLAGLIASLAALPCSG